MSDTGLAAFGLGLLGAVFGSFIATVAVRWPASAMAGRSACDGCGRMLAGYELVPLASWIVLRGKCRGCGGRIAWLHPAIEAIAICIGVAAGASGGGWNAVVGAMFGWLLLAAAAIDLVAFRLPNVLTLCIATSGLVTGLLGLQPTLVDRAIGGLAGFGALWLIATTYYRLRARTGLGGGDVKLLGAIGVWLGWRALPWVVVIACTVGLGWAAARRLRAGDRLPFGTLLAAGAFVMWIVARLG